MSTEAVGVGIIGLGFMGRTHLAAYQRAEADGLPCRVVAVSDRDPARLTGKADPSGNINSGARDEQLFDPSQVATFPDVDELLSSDAVQLVSVCTHTETHVDLAMRAMRAGKHVLVEKPVALTIEAVETLIREADRTGRICMPAMCMRFWPGWSWLKEQSASAAYGRIVSARFERLGAAPSWGGGFYSDFDRSGGALFDLHVHDVDFVYHLFGQASAVNTVGTLAHLTTTFACDSVPGQVVAEGGWLTSPSFPFRMRYVVEFERAVADFDIARDSPLMVHTEHESREVELSGLNGYDGEIRHAIDLVTGRADRPQAPLADALCVTRMILAERASLEAGHPVPVDA